MRIATIKYETAPGTKVDGGYVVPDIFIYVKRRGFIGWLFRALGIRAGYEEKKMHEALLSDQAAIGRAVEVKRGTVIVETPDGDIEYTLDIEGLSKRLAERTGDR